MRLISGKTGWALAAALLLLPAGARAQEASTNAAGEPTVLALQADGEEADREALRRFLGRQDVQRIAGMADVDLAGASAGVLALDGARLARAADQARSLESRMGASDSITISATTVIIVLLLILLIVVVAG